MALHWHAARRALRGALQALPAPSPPPSPRPTSLPRALRSAALSSRAGGTPPAADAPRGAGGSAHAVDQAAFHDVTLRDLMRARVHQGHRKSLWNAKMAPYILGHRNGMHVIDLDNPAAAAGTHGRFADGRA